MEESRGPMTPDLQTRSLMAKHGLPDWTHDELLAYIARGQLTGSFLTAVLSNDLREAVHRCCPEDYNILAMFIVFLYNHAPAGCWGSPEAVETWRAHHGLAGLPV